MDVGNDSDFVSTGRSWWILLGEQSKFRLSLSRKIRAKKGVMEISLLTALSKSEVQTAYTKSRNLDYLRWQASTSFRRNQLRSSHIDESIFFFFFWNDWNEYQISSIFFLNNHNKIGYDCRKKWQPVCPKVSQVNMCTQARNGLSKNRQLQ